MKEHMTLGSSPVSETCAQIGDPDYERKSILECEAFKDQLKRRFEAIHERPAKCRLRVKSHPHDFGSYLEVGADYDPENEAELEDVMWFEANLPESWDEAALAALRQGLS